MIRKMIFFDIDGTILSHRTYQISDSTRNAIKKAQEKGHLAFINTGRTLAEIDKSIIDIGFDGYVCGCGTYISYQEEVLLHQTIQPELIRDLIRDLHCYRLEAVFEGTSAIYYDKQVTSDLFRNVWYSQAEELGLTVKTWEDPDISFDKFCIIPLPEGSYSDFYEKYKAHFEFIDRGNNFYEIVPLGFSKATGIRFLEQYLNLSHDNTYALGDSSNDLSMLNYVKHSIAMANSSQDILAMASYITEDVDKDGVSQALKHFSII